MAPAEGGEAMRMADRVLADGVAKPAHHLGVRDHDGWLQRQAEAVLRTHPPVLLADNVAEYVSAHGFVIGSLPCEAPPWPEFWVEHRGGGPSTRIGALVQDYSNSFKDGGEFVNLMDGTDLGKRLVRSIRKEGGDPDRTRFVVCHQVYVEQRKRVVGPVCFVMLALDERGRQLGNVWQSLLSATAFGDEMTDAEVDEYVAGMASVSMQTVAFLHCKNVGTEEHYEPREKIRKSHKRRHGTELVRWQTVRLQVPRRQGGGQGTGSGDPTALHIVAGHFAHFGDCCPGQHEPNGKLFGRSTGVYWMASHVRGDPAEGSC